MRINLDDDNLWLGAALRISLIICSRNRARSLQRCLSAVQRSDARHTSAEVIVVDNGSLDETADLLENFSYAAAFELRCMTETRIGLSCARNAGVSVAGGDVVAFTDDDCYIDVDYFSACAGAFSSGQFDFCGGRILPYDATDARYGYNTNETFKLIPAGSFIAAGQIQGANMAYRRSVFSAVGCFDPRLGAGTPFRCEDIEYASRASLAGFVGAHVPQMTVYHHHGRAPEQIDDLKRLNDFARGAYYAKCISEGHWGYLPFWARQTWRKRKYISFSKELHGALSYLTSG